MIEVRGLTKKFGDETILNNVSFSIKAGERVSLTGPGGCGKTTLLKVLLGLLTPELGSATLLGTALYQASEAERALVYRKVGVAFQQGGLFDFMNVRENMLFAMKNMTEQSDSDMNAISKRLLAGVKLGHTENLYPHELSGGMKRRVGIARALCTDPLLAIFDEPTAGLDPVTSTIILNMILALAGEATEQKALLVCTSNVELAVRFAERMIIMRDGAIVADGSWRELLIHGDEWVRHFLSARFIGLTPDYARELQLPPAFMERYYGEQERSRE